MTEGECSLFPPEYSAAESRQIFAHIHANILSRLSCYVRIFVSTQLQSAFSLYYCRVPACGGRDVQLERQAIPFSAPWLAVGPQKYHMSTAGWLRCREPLAVFAAPATAVSRRATQRVSQVCRPTWPPWPPTAWACHPRAAPPPTGRRTPIQPLPHVHQHCGTSTPLFLRRTPCAL